MRTRITIGNRKIVTFADYSSIQYDDSTDGYFIFLICGIGPDKMPDASSFRVQLRQGSKPVNSKAGLLPIDRGATVLETSPLSFDLQVANQYLERVAKFRLDVRSMPHHLPAIG